jgi:sulfur-oxidizing protein SoxX
MKTKLIVTALLATTALATTLAVQAGDKHVALLDKAIAASFLPGEGQDLTRLIQDETLKLCSQYRNNPPEKVATAIVAREGKNMKHPEGGKLMGDWKKGEKLFSGGFGMRIGSIEADKPEKQKGGNGGNCYACHAADPKEVAAGNIGPSLTAYGKLRGSGDDMVKYTYEKIFNPQAYAACSNMPRIGHNGILKPEQIADITAYLISPESPVNK